VTTEFEQAVARAAELTEELARLIGVLRAAEPAAVPSGEIVDLDALRRLIDGLGSDEEVFGLVSSFGTDLAARVERWQIAERSGDADQAKRLMIDLRSTSELFGAVGVGAWCRRRTSGEHASSDELEDLVERTRRSLTVWRLSMQTEGVPR
jgi:hypothetical protein